jgi:hypothetical protein
MIIIIIILHWERERVYLVMISILEEERSSNILDVWYIWELNRQGVYIIERSSFIILPLLSFFSTNTTPIFVSLLSYIRNDDPISSL